MVLATSLSLRPYQLDPWFLWAPPAARTVLFTWARDVYLAQLAIITDPFEALPDDCAGDVLDYFGMAMNRVEALHVAAQWSSPEVRAWVRAVIVAAVSVKSKFLTDFHFSKYSTWTSYGPISIRRLINSSYSTSTTLLILALIVTR